MTPPAPTGSWSSSSSPAATLSNGSAGGAFGYSVALSADGTTALVGAEGADGGKGAVYVFHVSSAGDWASATALRPVVTLSDPAAANADYFGSSVALSADGTTAVVGAYGYEGSTGAVYVFHVPAEASWASTAPRAPVATLADPGAASGDAFGTSVAVSGDGSTAFVGAVGVSDGDGAVYVFHPDGAWTPLDSRKPVATLTNSAGSGAFGSAVAVSGDGSTVVVGSNTADGDAGGAFVFHASGEGLWVTSSAATSTLAVSGGKENDAFGSAVAISNDGTTVLVGAPGRRADTGATSVFHAAGETSWSATATPEATLNGPNGHSGDYFGWSLALSSDGGTALVGAYGVNSPNGAAYVYQAASATSWVTRSSPKALTNGTTGGDFGRAVALSMDGDTALIAADQASGGAGAAYVFTSSAASTAPGPVTDLTATPGDGTVNLHWAPPASGGRATTYAIYLASGDLCTGFTKSWSVPASRTTYEVSGLNDGVTVSLIVRARNAAGPGPGTPAAATPARPGTTLPNGATMTLTANGQQTQINLTDFRVVSPSRVGASGRFSASTAAAAALTSALDAGNAFSQVVVSTRVAGLITSTNTLTHVTVAIGDVGSCGLLDFGGTFGGGTNGSGSTGGSSGTTTATTTTSTTPLPGTIKEVVLTLESSGHSTALDLRTLSELTKPPATPSYAATTLDSDGTTTLKTLLKQTHTFTTATLKTIFTNGAPSVSIHLDNATVILGPTLSSGDVEFKLSGTP